MSDVAGYRAMTDVDLQLNYKIQLPSLGAEIGVGPSIGMRQFGFNNPRFRARQGGDSKIPMDDFTINENKFNLGFGAYYSQNDLSPTFKKLFGGISATNILSPEYDLQTVKEVVVPHFYLVAGAEYEINPTLLLEPTVLVKAGSFRPQIDLNSTVLWNNMFRGGLAYRQWGTFDAISLLFGYRNEDLRLEVGYSYDITISPVNTVSNGTHEIMVRYCHPIKTTDPKPKNTIRTPRFL
jgi:type IX secretion system PorP/SprF family membrane protein